MINIFTLIFFSIISIDYPLQCFNTVDFVPTLGPTVNGIWYLIHRVFVDIKVIIVRIIFNTLDFVHEIKYLSYIMFIHFFYNILYGNYYLLQWNFQWIFYSLSFIVLMILKSLHSPSCYVWFNSNIVIIYL